MDSENVESRDTTSRRKWERNLNKIHHYTKEIAKKGSVNKIKKTFVYLGEPTERTKNLSQIQC